MLRLFELIRDTSFGLQLVTRGTSTNRRIDGGHVVEMSDPGQWLAPNYLALTTGVALKGRVARQEEFVASVQRAGGTALGFGVGVRFRRIPPAIIAAGEQLGLPIVSVPLEVPFREVLTFISRSTLTTGFQDFSRALRLQDYLLASLGESDAEASLARRLGELVIGSAAVFRCDGRLAACAGRPPLAAMWTAIREETHVVQLAHKRLLWAEARVGGEPQYYLAACVRDDDRSEAYCAEVLKFGARVAQAVAAAHQVAAVQERAARVSGRTEARTRAPDATARLEALSTAVEACESVLSRGRVPYLTCIAAGRSAVAVWQDASEDASVVQALREAATERSLSIGLARPAEDMSHLQQALTEAEVALRRAEGMAEPAVITYDELALFDVVLTHCPPELSAVAQSMLEPLQSARSDMFQTLVEYLEHDCDVIACANLFLHPNTLRYRLSRIETLLGRSLRSVSTIAELHLALRLQEINTNTGRLQSCVGSNGGVWPRRQCPPLTPTTPALAGRKRMLHDPGDAP
jgi:purine catabolism regulator